MTIVSRFQSGDGDGDDHGGADDHHVGVSSIPNDLFHVDDHYPHELRYYDASID